MKGRTVLAALILEGLISGAFLQYGGYYRSLTLGEEKAGAYIVLGLIAMLWCAVTARIIIQAINDLRGTAPDQRHIWSVEVSCSAVAVVYPAWFLGVENTKSGLEQLWNAAVLAVGVLIIVGMVRQLLRWRTTPQSPSSGAKVE